MSEHATRSDLQGYVTGALVETRAAWLERHAVVCDACAAALAGEARIEMALETVCAARPAPLRRVARFASAGFASLAAAAVVLLVLGVAHGRDRAASVVAQDGAAPAGVIPQQPLHATVYACADGADGAPCAGDGASAMQ